MASFERHITGVDHRTRAIEGVQFSILGADEIERRAACEITNGQTYAGDVPVTGGLFDPRLGAVEGPCATCSQSVRDCPHHPGFLRLAFPLYGPATMAYARKLIRMICFECSRPVSQMLVLKYPSSPARQFVYAYKDTQRILASKGNNDATTCPHCSAVRPIWKCKSPYTLEGIFPHSTEYQHIYADEAYPVFKRITNHDATLLGFNPKFCRPENLIWTVMPIPSPSVRPSVKFGVSRRGDDDLTTLLSDIIKKNSIIRSEMNKVENGDSKPIQHILRLQHAVLTYIDNAQTGIPVSMQNSGRHYKSLYGRLKGKHGRLRNNLLGKRVDHSARTVASSDPFLSIDYAGIPYKIAMNITIPEMVIPTNLEKMKVLIQNGPHKHPGAKYIIKAGSNETFAITSAIHPSSLKIGDIVYRHVMDDDPIVVNRQPTLHRMSMMTHKARILDHATIRISVCTTPGYAGDFDGDELNFHVCQSKFTQVETMLLGAPSTQILGPRRAEPLLGIVQDLALGVYLLTGPGVKVSREMFMSYVGTLPRPDMVKAAQIMEENQDMIPGADVFSMVLPAISLRHKDVLIMNGRLIEGRVNKGTFQAHSTGILHTVISLMGHAAARRVIDGVQKLTLLFLMDNGFSVGIEDLIIGEGLRETVNKMRNDFAEASDRITEAVHTRKFDNNVMTGRQYVEKSFTEQLNPMPLEKQLTDLLHGGKDNRFLTLATSGAKGKLANIMQMVGIIGQQHSGGSRISTAYDYRTTPHFPKYDQGAKSRGFVFSSYNDGLDPIEYFHHAVKGRLGLINTAVSTASTGYLNRQLNKALEDIHINQQLCVTDRGGNIIQFVYGGDALDYTRHQFERAPMAEMDYEEFAAEYLVPNPESNKHIESFNELLMDYRDNVITGIYEGKKFDDMMVNTPIHMGQLLFSMFNDYGRDTEGKQLTDAQLCEQLLAFLDELYVVRVEGTLLGAEALQTVICMNMTPPQIRKEYGHITAQEFSEIAEAIRRRYQYAVISPGEAVGIITAQSFGELATQATLDDFKTVGADAGSLLRGTPRVQEILSFTANLKSPAMNLRLKPAPLDKNGEVVELDYYTMSKQILEVTFEDIVSRTRVFHAAPEKLVDKYSSLEPMLAMTPDTKTPTWILVFYVTHHTIVRYNLQPENVYMALYANFGDQYTITFSPLSADENPSMQYIFVPQPHAVAAAAPQKVSISGYADSTDIAFDITQYRQRILSSIVQGSGNIRDASPAEVQTTLYNHESGKWENVTENYIRTAGTSFLNAIQNENVDPYNSFSNDLHEMYHVLGIEAAVQVMINELYMAVGKTRHDTIAFRHTSLVADFATSTGTFVAFNRTGVNRNDLVSPLTKASFEESTIQLVKAGVFGEFDDVRGVAPAIIMGQLPRLGTFYSDVLIDTDRLKFASDVAAGEAVQLMGITEEGVTADTKAALIEALEQLDNLFTVDLRDVTVSFGWLPEDEAIARAVI